MNAAALSNLFGPPAMTWPSWLTWIKSEALISEKERPKGFTQKVEGSTGSRRVMWPATPVCCQHASMYTSIYIWMDGWWMDTLIKAILPENAKRSSQSTLEILAFCVFVFEDGGFGEGHFDLLVCFRVAVCCHFGYCSGTVYVDGSSSGEMRLFKGYTPDI